MRNIKKLISILCPFFLLSSISYANESEITSVENKNDLFKINPVSKDTIEIKVRCAGSSHTSPCKVVKKSSSSKDNLEDKNFQNYEISRSYLENKNSKYSDLYEQMPLIDVDLDIEDCHDLYWSTDRKLNPNSRLKKSLKRKDLFFKLKDQEWHLPKLELYRPGVGSDEVFFKVPPVKLVGMSVPRGSLNRGQFSIENTTRIISNTLLDYIDDISPVVDSIRLSLQGHSRGAVGLARALDKLLSELDTFKYEKNLKNKRLEIDCILLDPVAGPDVSSKKLKLTAINPSVRVKLTQLFSTYVGRPTWQSWAFASSAHIPTSVSDSTVVFLPMNHDVGSSSMSVDSEGKLHKLMWKYGDKLLKFGEIGKLEPGVYFPKTEFAFCNQGSTNGKNNKEKSNNENSKVDQKSPPPSQVLITKNNEGELTPSDVNQPESTVSPLNNIIEENLNTSDNDNKKLDEVKKSDPILLDCSNYNLPVKMILPPVELVKVTDCSDKTLDELQSHLLIDKNWVNYSNRKKTFLELLNKSLHIDGILPKNKNLDFDSNFKLRISKGKKAISNKKS